MLGHLWLPLPPGAGGWADGDGLAARDDVADVCELAVPVFAPVEALAMVRPRARLAPSAPAPTAVPMSGRVILTWFSFAPPGRAPGDRPAGTGRVGPRRQVGQAGLAGGWAAPLRPVSIPARLLPPGASPGP